jgi:predicted aspartyl protease
MIITTGFIDASGNACVEVEISGAFSTPATKFTCIIDTGFTGFLSMPLVEAFPLGLPLCGSTKVILADGSEQAKLLAQAKAKIGHIENYGLVILEPSSKDILLGMDFIRSFNATLFVSSSIVALADDSELQQAMAGAATSTSAPIPPSPPPTTP